MNDYLIIAAVLPAAVLLYMIWRADRLEKEPVRLLIKLLLFGVLATFAAVVLETIGDFIAVSLFGNTPTVYDIVENFIVVALSEEGLKYLFLKKLTWKQPEFNCRFDAVVYSVFVSLGFALWENIGYVFAYGLSNALARAVTAVPAHACFGVFMGLWYGNAKFFECNGQEQLSKKYLSMALWLPVLMHGFYDYTATMMSYGSALLFIGYIIAVFVYAVRTVKYISRSDDYFIRPVEPVTDYFIEQ